MHIPNVSALFFPKTEQSLGQNPQIRHTLTKDLMNYLPDVMENEAVEPPSSSVGRRPRCWPRAAPLSPGPSHAVLVSTLLASRTTAAAAGNPFRPALSPPLGHGRGSARRGRAQPPLRARSDERNRTVPLLMGALLVLLRSMEAGEKE